MEGGKRSSPTDLVSTGRLLADSAPTRRRGQTQGDSRWTRRDTNTWAPGTPISTGTGRAGTRPRRPLGQAHSRSTVRLQLAIRTVEKLNSGTAAPRLSIEARIRSSLKALKERLQDSYPWVKGHKDIKGNEAVDKLSKRPSILGHESEGVVTLAGLRAWSRRVGAEARGGRGNGLLGWGRKATLGKGAAQRVAIQDRQG